MAIFYGSDVQCIEDFGPVDIIVTNPRQLIGERIARLLQTPRGALGLIGDDPSVGWDVRQYVNGKTGPLDLSFAQTQIRNECLKDEQVLEASVAITASGNSMTISIEIASSEGPFTLTLDVQDLTVKAVFNFT